MSGEDREWLSKAILGYIKEHTGNVDAIDIVAHFTMRVDIVLDEVKNLILAGMAEGMSTKLRRELYER